MKKNIIIFLSGFLFSLVALEGAVRLLSPLLGPPLTKWNTMEDAKILKLEEFRYKYSSPDYVFMGNSTTLIGLNPDVFNAEMNLPTGSSFNAAMNGSEIRQIRDFALGYILGEIRPKNLVLLFSNSAMATNVDYEIFNSQPSKFGEHSYIYRYRNTFRDPLTLNTLLRVLKFHDTRQGIVYRWADNLDDFGYTRYDTTDSEILEEGWDPFGFIPDKQKQKQSIKLLGMKYLIEIRDFARSQRVNLIIGTVPTLSYDARYRGEIEAMANYLGVPFIQGNDAVGKGEYFQDGVHLNMRGAAEFSEFLSRELSTLG
jgi:hypothetical protein